ncbi:conserved Plasmodium protein, unknown function [Plasmodium ovale]|uniref:Uncharacterized protein n=1 Tax=Plasmodium ovale TaxID=36330 RepID=A0A1C3KMU9_PLAOA|nr:conserved Plasmodium protein, unknown function [Plasmodium ovale]
MLNCVKSLSRRQIYRLHMENDKIIDMPMFLADSLYVRNKEELISLLRSAVSFDKKKFVHNYKRVLLKGHISGNYENAGGAKFDKISEDNGCVGKFENLEKAHYDDHAADNNDTEKTSFLRSGEEVSTHIVNSYKYNNDEYDELINCLSEKYCTGESYLWGSFSQEEEDEAYIEYTMRKKRNEGKNPLEYNQSEGYSLIGYIPNDYFFQTFQKRIISMKDYLTFNDICELIYIYSKKRDVPIMRVLVEQYIHKREKEKEKSVNYKHSVHLLNIFLKLNCEKYNVHNVVKYFKKSLCLSMIGGNDLKVSVLGFSCLSKLNMYNIQFYCYVSTFLSKIDECSPMCCSMILHCLGYHIYYFAKKRKELFKKMRFIKRATSNGSSREHPTDRASILTDWGNVTDAVECDGGSLHSSWKNPLEMQIWRKNKDLLSKVESKIIDRLVKIDLRSISDRSISSIFHFYFLKNTSTLGEKDKILFSKLIDVLIKNDINFSKPRSFLMSSYTLIIHRYFTNIDVSSYFLMQCTKLIGLLKGKVYLDNLLFVLKGFAQNHMIFYKKKKNSTFFPKIYIDMKNKKLCNFKVENKYVDMLERYEYDVNKLEKDETKPVSCRSAILYILNEIINLDYDLNKKQTLLYLQLFASFDIKLGTDIKKKVFTLIINRAHELISYVSIIFQLAICIFGISSSYLKTIGFHFLEKMDIQLDTFYQLIKKNKEEHLFQYINGTLTNYTSGFYTHLLNLDILSDVLFIFDQIDVNKKNFVLNLTNLIYSNNYLILTYKKNDFNSYVYFLHYIGCMPIDTESYTKVVHFIVSSLRNYVELSYSDYLNRGRNVTLPDDAAKNDSGVEETPYRGCSDGERGDVVSKMGETVGKHEHDRGDRACTDVDCYFDEVQHDIIRGKIFIKDLVLLLDALRIHKEYRGEPLLTTVATMITCEKIRSLSDEDIELVNYIFLDMGLANKHAMDEARNRGITFGLK